jgi:glutamate 5-kinase
LIKYKRVVIKIGSAVLTEQNRLAKERILSIVQLVVKLREAGIEVIIVSSGAVSAGYTQLKIDKKILANRQALASVGQSFLMSSYQKKFDRYGLKVAQLLLIEEDFRVKTHIENAKNTVEVLLQNGVVPIINENDTVAVEELRFGDNDQLSAHSTFHFEADLLVILSDIDGYYTANPREDKNAEIRPHIEDISESELSQSATPNSPFATGGIVTKLKAGKYLIDRGLNMFLSSGFQLQYVEEMLLKGTYEKGSLFGKIDG